MKLVAEMKAEFAASRSSGGRSLFGNAKLLQPKRFSGDKRQTRETLHTWLFTFEEFMNLQNLPKELWSRMAGQHLEGAAQLWYETRSKELPWPAYRLGDGAQQTQLIIPAGAGRLGTTGELLWPDGNGSRSHGHAQWRQEPDGRRAATIQPRANAPSGSSWQRDSPAVSASGQATTSTTAQTGPEGIRKLHPKATASHRRETGALGGTEGGPGRRGSSEPGYAGEAPATDAESQSHARSPLDGGAGEG